MDMYLILLSVKQGGIKYHFKSLWYDVTWDWNQVFQTIGEGLMSRMFVNGPRDQDSILGRVIPKTQKMLPGAALLNTQYCKVWIKGKVEQSREWSSVLPNTVV